MGKLYLKKKKKDGKFYKWKLLNMGTKRFSSMRRPTWFRLFMPLNSNENAFKKKKYISSNGLEGNSLTQGGSVAQKN